MIWEASSSRAEDYNRVTKLRLDQNRESAKINRNEL